MDTSCASASHLVEQRRQGQHATPKGGALPDAQANYNLLSAFIQAASSRSIVAGVQATLLLDLAAELCRDNSGSGAHGAVASDFLRASTSEPCAATGLPAISPVAEPQPAGTMAADAATAACQPPQVLQQHTSALAMPSIGATSSSSEVTGLTMFPQQQPLLHIAPLDLNINSTAAPAAATGLGMTSSSLNQDASAMDAVTAAAAAASALDQHAAGLLGLGSFAPNAGSTMCLPPALLAAATQAQQQQQQASAAVDVVEAAAAYAQQQQQHLYSSHLDSFGMYPAASTTATLAAAAAGAAELDSAAAAAQLQDAAAGPPLMLSTSQHARSARKQRFTREQQQAILECVERFYAACPSRYTELVIKHMQERFPGIEISNACVRKIKFRANEALKQHGEVNRRESQAAADAAHGLVGLAAAAAAADVPVDAAAAAAAAAVVPARSGSFAAFACAGATSEIDTADGEEDGAFSRELSEVPGSSSKQQQQQQLPQQQVSQQQLQLGQLSPPQLQQQQAEETAFAGLAVQQLSPRSLKRSDDGGGADAAAVEAAEGLHMLMKSSNSFTGRSAGSPAEAAAAAAVAGDAADAAGSLKRKLEATVDEADLEAAATAAAEVGKVPQPQQQQLAEALAAAAGCSMEGVAGTAVQQQQQQQAVALHAACSDQQQQQLAWQTAASTPFQAAANSPALQLAHIQQQLVHQLHQQHAVAAAAGSAQPQQSASLAAALQLQHYNSASSLAAAAAAAASMPAASALSTGSMPISSAAYAAAAAAGCSGEKPAKRQRLNGVQMAELVASVRHHVQANPERYTHCVIRDMKEKYPDLELNMGQVRKIKFRTLGNVNPRQGSGKPQQQQQSGGCCASDADHATQAQPPASAAAAGLLPFQQQQQQHIMPAVVSPAAAAAAASLPGAAGVDFSFAGLASGLLPGQLPPGDAPKLLTAAAATNQQAGVVPAAAAADAAADLVPVAQPGN